VHNGIIENHVVLRAELQREGRKLSSDTDTEVIAHLVHRELTAHAAPTLLEAVRRALERVVGTYAIAVVSRDEPGVIVAARNGSPLVVGIGDDEMLCGSDVTALLSHTREMVFLEDGDLVELKQTSYRIETVHGRPVERPIKHIDWSAVQAEKGGFKHFMLKEIHEQPDAVEATLRGKIDARTGDLRVVEMGVSPSFARELRRVYFVACGTSHHAAMVGRYWIEKLARVPSVVELASEVRDRDPVFFADDLVVAVSQSGETADTLAAVRAARAAGAQVLALSNVLDSALPRIADGALYTHAGPEIGVASTKCFTTQLAALLLFTVFLGRERGSMSMERARGILQALREAPSLMREALADTEPVLAIAKQLVSARDVLYLGRGLGYPVALEGALKLKEISYAHAEGYAAGEMKHGPIALIDHTLPVIVVCPRDSHQEKMLSNIQEVRAREGRVIAVATRGDEAMTRLADQIMWVPGAREELSPLLTVLPLQLLAYHVANLKGNDVDQPRNLAKTVTVE
jgi:glucosamine--fructose-6-phosphate aminotransferase (isomerizing)